MANLKDTEGRLRALFSANKETLKKIGVKFESTVKIGANALTKDGKTISTDADAWAAGVPAFIYDEATDSTTPVEDGSYELKNGDTLVIEGGIVKEIVPMTAAQMSEDDLAKIVEASQELAATCETLEADKAKLEAEKADLEKEVTALKAEAVKMQADIAALKKKPATVSLSATPAPAPASEKPQTVKDRVLASMDAIGN